MSSPNLMMEEFERKLEVVSKRWPHFGRLISRAMAEDRTLTIDTPEVVMVHKGIHLSSAFSPNKEAEVQASRLPEMASEVWVYGIGAGYLPDHLLGRPALQVLNLVFFNFQLLAESLASYPHEWVNDTRVRLFYAEDIDDVRHPFAAVYAELSLAEVAAARLRDRVIIELDARLRTERLAQRQERYDKPNIQLNKSSFKNDRDVQIHFQTYPNSIVTVIAGGPSAQSFLANPQPSDCLIVVSTALKAVLLAGLVPDFVVAIDGHPGMVRHLSDIEDMAVLEQTILAYAPTIPPAMLNIWPGSRCVFYLDTALFQKIAEYMPHSTLYCSGTVTHCAVDLATRLGASQVRLVGADFGFPGGFTHVEHAVKRQQATSLAQVINRKGEIIASKPALIAYLRDLESYIEKHPEVEFISMSDEGANIVGAGIYREKFDE